MRRRCNQGLAFCLLLLGGCASTYEHGPLRPEVDLSPVGCGYKWFQSGYSPTLKMACDQDRSSLIDSQITLAREHAREVARARCPDTCAPTELVDSSSSGDAFPDGVCNAGYVYFTTRLFFQCVGP